MKFRTMLIVALLAPAVTALAATGNWADGTAFTYQGQVNISGSTLFSGFYGSPASTNDAIDVDGNGFSGYNQNTPPYVQQLAPSPDASNPYWLVQFYGVGSGGGLKELDLWHAAPINTADSNWTGNVPDPGTINGVQFLANGGQHQGQYVGANSAYYGTPVVPNTIDIAAMDVGTKWLIQGPTNTAAASWNATPTTAGYGQNPTNSVAGQSNKLKTLTNTNVNTANPDANTIFDTGVAYVPVAVVANRGTGLENVTQTQLQQLYVTGRMPNGEHLTAMTREAGSGTRNAAMNSIGVDPSWGAGANLNAKQDVAANYPLGPNHTVTNIASTGGLEKTLTNSRLAVGYAGLNGVGNAVQYAASGNFEILNVMMDQKGGNQYVRPTLQTVIHNTQVNYGWQMAGIETLATVGSPVYVPGGKVPQMANQYAASYINNITGSIANFSGNPNANVNYDMPGEYLASNFFLTAGVDSLPDQTSPMTYNAQVVNANVQNYMLNNNLMGVGYDTPAYGSVNDAGLVPQNLAGTYVDSGGNTLVAGAALSKRNQIQDDFNYDGKRNVDDIATMMQAIHDPANFEKNNNNHGDGFVCVAVIGDNNGDGVFDAKDVRYFADGLAIATGGPHAGNLDRNAGFKAVDNAWTYNDVAGHPAGNYFNTSLKTGTPYVAGDSIGDINNDGVVDAKDIDYLQLVLRGGLVPTGVTPAAGFMADGSLHWSNINEAVYCDLGCDLTGDLVVGHDDIDYLVQTVLNTHYGDANLDGKVSFADYLLVEANFGKSGMGFEQGDFNGDGKVSFADYLVLEANFGKSAYTPEPATVGMLLLGVVPALLRRRK